jgi:hypothetical protein
MIYFSFEMKKKIQKQSNLEASIVLFNATLKKNHSNFSSHILTISVTCDDLQVDICDDLTELTEVNDFETIYTSCKSISKIFRGKFIYSPGRIEISICCQGNKWENVTPKNKIVNKDSHSEKTKWKGGINFAKVTALINNKSEIDIIKPLLNKFNIKHSIVFLYQDHKKDLDHILSSTDVVVIANETVLNILKSGGYRNYVMLISSSIHYLSSSIFKFVDFILPFPYSKQDTKKLQLWFDSPTNLRLTNHLEYEENRNRFGLSTEYLSFRMNKFTPDIEISFMEWRVLNPTNRFFHVSKLVDVSYFIFQSAVVFQTFFSPSNTNSYNFFSAILIWIIVLLRNKVYKLFAKIKNPFFTILFRYISLRTFWTVIPNIISVTVIMRAISFYIHYQNNLVEFDNLEQLTRVDYKFYSLNINGSVIITEFIMQSYATLLWAMNVPWPFSLLLLFSICLRSTCYQVLIFRYFINNDPIFITILSLHIVYYLYVGILMYYFEDTQRNEFRKYRIRNDSRISMRNSIRLCQKDMKLPLNNILTNYNSFLFQLNNRCKDFDSFNSQKGKVLIGDVNSLYSPIYLLNEINFLFSYKNKESNNHKKSVNQVDNFKLTNPMLTDIILLKYELQRIAYIFQTCKYSMSMNLKIYLIVDSDLSLIKTNKKVLCSIITNAISVAIKKINYKIEIDTDIRGKEVHEITIQVNSVDYTGANSRPFFYMRSMVIDIYDTGCPIPNNMNMFGTSICQQMRDDMYYSKDNENLKLKKREIFNVSNKSRLSSQRIVFPYTLHEMTLKVGSIFKYCDQNAFDCFNIHQLSIKLKFYENWTINRFSASVNSHNLSMCFVCPIEDINSKLNQNEFFCHGWKLDKVNYIDQIALEPSLLLSNIIVIDYSTYKVNTEISFFFSDSNSHGLNYTCNYLRLLGFKGIIVLLFANIEKYEESIKESNENSSYRRNETCIVNDYIVLYQPIVDIALNNLVESYLHHEISMLLNPKLVTLH